MKSNLTKFRIELSKLEKDAKKCTDDFTNLQIDLEEWYTRMNFIGSEIEKLGERMVKNGQFVQQQYNFND